MKKLVYGVVFGILVTQWAGAAPSDIKLEDIAAVKVAEQTENNEPPTLVEDTESEQGQRQKRWYTSNYIGFGGIPATPPVLYKRDDNRYTGIYGAENPLVEIQRRLQELNGFVRNPPQTLAPPIIPHFPQVIPIFYIPQVGCGCIPNDTPNNPAPPQNTNVTDNPDVNNRLPPFEDSNQNWGLVNNEAPPVDDGNDGARPISFEPIKPNRPMKRPPPPVEHGSIQGDINSLASPTQSPFLTTIPPRSGTSPPSLCDKAVLVCCLTQQERDSNCFASQGCPNPAGGGDACDSRVVLPIIRRLERYYKQRNG